MDRYFYSNDICGMNVLYPSEEPIQYRPYLRSKEYSRIRFQVKVDVKSFKSEDISVRVKDNYIIIEGKHEKRDLEGFVTVRFSHSYIIPEEYDPSSIQWYYSSYRVVTITAKRLQPPEVIETERLNQVLLINSGTEDLSEIIEEEDVVETGEEVCEGCGAIIKEE
ncbi:unnamed protein product [Diamesa serratosioi]